MLNFICNFTCKSLGVAVVVTEFKFDVSKSIESSNSNCGNNQPEVLLLDDDDDDNDNMVRMHGLVIMTISSFTN